jgi:hypothetical protein
MILRWWRRRRPWGYVVTAIDPQSGRRVIVIDERRTCATRPQAEVCMKAARAIIALSKYPKDDADVQFILTAGLI